MSYMHLMVGRVGFEPMTFRCLRVFISRTLLDALALNQAELPAHVLMAYRSTV